MRNTVLMLLDRFGKRPRFILVVGGTMTSKVRPKVRRVGLEQFPRWVIFDDGGQLPNGRRFWNGAEWVAGLQNAALFAHRDLVLEELQRAKRE